MLGLDSYFSDKNIIDLLSKIRSKEAQKRHDIQFYRNISKNAPNPNTLRSYVSTMLPPRREWYRPNLSERLNKSALEINTLAIKKTVEYQTKLHIADKKSWYKELMRFCDDVKKTILQNQNYQICKPRVIPVEKNKKEKSYRPIAVYDLKDRIIIGITAKYLRDTFDNDFQDNSYAFRAKSKNTKTTKTYHSAILDLIKYKKNYDDRDLFVSECDIQKFYDIVNHKIAINSFNKAIKKANLRGIYVDSRAIVVFQKYLESYTFNKTATIQCKKWFKNHGVVGNLNWPIEHLKKIYNDLEHESLGVPQGGALSPLTANLVLDQVDNAVLYKNGNKDMDLFYARYCDDMIIIHPIKKECENTFKRYLLGLKKLKLIAHTPMQIGFYSKKFYEIKSKKAYIWSNNKKKQKYITLDIIFRISN